jgi:PIN domain nuclease of toxin-antitoxin system
MEASIDTHANRVRALSTAEKRTFAKALIEERPITTTDKEWSQSLSTACPAGQWTQ